MPDKLKSRTGAQVFLTTIKRDRKDGYSFKAIARMRNVNEFALRAFWQYHLPSSIRIRKARRQRALEKRRRAAKLYRQAIKRLSACHTNAS